MNKVFDPKRIVFLLRKDFLQGWRSMLAPTGSVMGILILWNIALAMFENQNPASHFFGIVQTLLFAMGFIATSRAFTEMHDKNRCDDYILLPASSIEKTFTRLFLVSIILPLYIIFIVLVSSCISEIFNAWVFRDPIAVFNPFDAEVGKTMLVFFLTQQVVLLGAAWFKKAHLVKTVLACLVILFIFFLLAFFTASIIFNDPDGYMFLGSGGMPLNYESMKSYLDFLAIMGKVLLGLLVVLCWVLTWMRVREVQSHHGI